jgi:hypothetical protein
MRGTRWILLGAVLALGTGAAQQADSYFAPPGLYELQATADLGLRKPDGSATAAVVQKPQLLCAKTAQGSSLPQRWLDSGCAALPGVVQGDRMVFDSSCPWGRVSLSFRRVDAQTWESSLEESRQPATGTGLRADPELRRMMGEVAASGAPAEREAARRSLAAMDAKQQDAAPVRTAMLVRIKRVARDCS